MTQPNPFTALSATATLLIGALALGCTSQTTEPAGAAGMHAPLRVSDFQQPWIRLPLPPSATYGDLESLISVPTGYAALYRKSLGQGKDAAGWVHRVFLSVDGVQWDEHDLPATPTWVDYRSLAYGADHYVIAGESGALDKGAVTSSGDTDTWQDVQTDVPAILNLTFLNDRFFGLALWKGIYASSDGIHFNASATDAVQLGAIAYGNGTYVAVGSGPFEVSHDGMTWHSVSLDCNMPGACVTPPSGPALQGFRSHVFFAKDNFYAEQFVSPDAQNWQAIRDAARVPDTFAAGWFLKLESNQLSAWQDSTQAQATEVRVDNPDQLDCRTRRCLLFSDALLLVP
jgi:hypothetical protein